MKGCVGRHLICALGVMLTAAGCTDTAPPDDLRPSDPLQTSSADTTRGAAPTHQAAHNAAAPSTEAIGTPAEAATQGVDRMIGLDEAEIQSVLGPPMLQEDRAPTKLWVFRSRSCTINVTLYPDVETRQFHALSYEVTSDAHSAERTRQCVTEFSSRFAQR
jgi:hypothetical protein